MLEIQVKGKRWVIVINVLEIQVNGKRWIIVYVLTNVLEIQVKGKYANEVCAMISRDDRRTNRWDVFFVLIDPD